jgi:HEAT repeat protein
MFGSKTSKIEKLTAKKKSEQLTKFLSDKDPAVRLAAIKGLGQAGGEPAFNSLVSLLRDSNANMREAAASALEVLKDPKSCAFLSARLKDETDASAKAAMNRALQAAQSRP